MSFRTTRISAHEIENLVSSFLNKTLPLTDWTHEAHLVTAVWHLHRFGKIESTHILRCRIIEYNEVRGNGNSFASGYHETVTLLWIWLISSYLQSFPGSLEDTVNRFLNTPLANGKWIFQFYSRECLTSDRARALWIEPDLRALDFLYLLECYQITGQHEGKS